MLHSTFGNASVSPKYSEITSVVGKDPPSGLELASCVDASQAPVTVGCFPFPLDPAGADPTGVDVASRPDVLVRTADVGINQLRVLPSLRAILPVIDASFAHGAAAYPTDELHLPVRSREALAEALSELRPMIERLRTLPASIWASADPRLLLLARLSVRERPLQPRRDPRVPETVRFPDEAIFPGLGLMAERLADQGFLRRVFFDRLTVCPRCASARLSLRELCCSCHSADLKEQAIIHHLRCSAQAPEQEFRQGSRLVCPHCRRDLEYFSVDYDRPGSVLVCGACGHASSDSAVGYVCLDCAAEGDAEQTSTRPVWSYELTEAGRCQVLSGFPLPEADGRPIRERVAAFLAKAKTSREPACILVARLHRGARPARDWEQVCGLFGHVFAETFTIDTETIASPPIFLAFLQGDSKEDVVAELPRIRQALEGLLRDPPEADYGVYGLEDVEPLLAGAAG